MHIGAHLAENKTLETLNLRLNRCEDNGVCHLLQDLCINKNLKRLNMSSNDLTHRCLAYLYDIAYDSEFTILMNWSNLKCFVFGSLF